MHRTILVGMILFLFQLTYGQEEKHPIDLRLEACLASDSGISTAGMIECLSSAANSWDGELNSYYDLLREALDSSEQEALTASQVSWLTYRDREFEFTNHLYGDMLGTIWRITSAQRRMNVVKQRALELKTYYKTLQFDQ